MRSRFGQGSVKGAIEVRQDTVRVMCGSVRDMCGTVPVMCGTLRVRLRAGAT